MRISVQNIFGRPIVNAKVLLFSVRDRRLVLLDDKTSPWGILNLRGLKEGTYVARIVKRNYLKEMVVILKKGADLSIRLGYLVGILPRRVYLSDKIFCFLCKYEYGNFAERFRCSYCNASYCTAHRLPEDHECFYKGKLRNLPPGYRAIHSKDKTDIFIE